MHSSINLSQLSEIAKMILDFLFNVPGTYRHEGVVENLELLASDRRELIQNEWDALIGNGIVVKPEYNFVVNPSLVADAKLTLEQYFKERDVSQESVASYLEGQVERDLGKLTIFANLMTKAYVVDNVERILFSDYDWSNELMSICDDVRFA